MDINMIVISGNIAKSPTSTRIGEVLYVNFPLAVNIGSREASKICCYSISSSGKNAEIILNHANVGDKLLITGRPSVDTYMGKDKQIIGVQKIWLEKFEFCYDKLVEHEAHQNQSLVESNINSEEKLLDTENKTNLGTENNSVNQLGTCLL